MNNSPNSKKYTYSSNSWFINFRLCLLVFAVIQIIPKLWLIINTYCKLTTIGCRYAGLGKAWLYVSSNLGPWAKGVSTTWGVLFSWQRAIVKEKQPKHISLFKIIHRAKPRVNGVGMTLYMSYQEAQQKSYGQRVWMYNLFQRGSRKLGTMIQSTPHNFLLIPAYQR